MTSRTNQNLCVQCEVFDNMCIRDQKCNRKDYNLVHCEDCMATFRFEDLADDLVETYREYHGQPGLTPEVVPKRWTCPECGHNQAVG